jgi:hypothetical protein
MRFAVYNLAFLSAALLAGCASTPKLDALAGEQYKFDQPTLVEIVDARRNTPSLEEKVDTSLGVGDRIDPKIINPPAYDTFKELLQDKLSQRGYTRTVGDFVALETFDIAYVQGRGTAQSVAQSPGVAGVAGSAGLYGLAGVVIVQLFENWRANVNAPSQIMTVLKMTHRGRVVACEGLGYIAKDDYSAALQQSLRSASYECAAKITDVAQAIEQEKAKTSTQASSPEPSPAATTMPSQQPTSAPQ